MERRSNLKKLKDTYEHGWRDERAFVKEPSASDGVLLNMNASCSNCGCYHDCEDGGGLATEDGIAPCPGPDVWETEEEWNEQPCQRFICPDHDDPEWIDHNLCRRWKPRGFLGIRGVDAVYDEKGGIRNEWLEQRGELKNHLNWALPECFMSPCIKQKQDSR